MALLLLLVWTGRHASESRTRRAGRATEQKNKNKTKYLDHVIRLPQCTLVIRPLDDQMIWGSAVLVSNSYPLPLTPPSPLVPPLTLTSPPRLGPPPPLAPPSASVSLQHCVRSLPVAGFPARSPPQQEMNDDRQISGTFILITLSTLANHSHRRSVSQGNT